MEDEKLVLIKQSEKAEIIESLNILIDEIHTGTETLKGSVMMIQRLLNKEIEAFDNKVSSISDNLLEATKAIEDLLESQ